MHGQRRYVGEAAFAAAVGDGVAAYETAAGAALARSAAGAASAETAGQWRRHGVVARPTAGAALHQRGAAGLRRHSAVPTTAAAFVCFVCLFVFFAATIGFDLVSSVGTSRHGFFTSFTC